LHGTPQHDIVRISNRLLFVIPLNRMGFLHGQLVLQNSLTEALFGPGRYKPTGQTILRMSVLSRTTYERGRMIVQMRVVLPSHPRYLCIARAMVRELGEVSGLREEDVHAVTLAVDEALANVMRHAYKGSHDQQIEFHCDVYDDRMEFRLLDSGEAPVAERICGQPLDEFSLSGRGTHLIREIMDDVCYERVAGRNQIKMIKNLPPQKVEGA
jgi:serine/threonine-protein kinase RsbW